MNYIDCQNYFRLTYRTLLLSMDAQVFLHVEDLFGFEEEEYDSDAESVMSLDEVNTSLDDWIPGSNVFDSFEFRNYSLKTTAVEERYENSSVFVNTVISELKNIRFATAVRLLADIHDLENEEDVRWSQNIRYEIDQFASSNELRDVMLEHVSSETAPVWHRLLTDETSDKGYNKLVKYHRNYFDFCVQHPNKTRTQATTVCGEREIHPGVFIKIVTDHNVVYGSNDCLIQCLNEYFCLRLDPMMVRKKIWPDRDGYDLLKDIHTPRHIRTIAMIYNARLVISDIVYQKNYVFNKEGTNIINLVKVGKCIGIVERVDHTVDKRNTIRSVVYFDLETAGPDQRVYAFTWRHTGGDMTMCHDDHDYIEQEFVNKIMDTIMSAEDNGHIVAYSWNGSRFDSWIALKLLKKAYNKKLWIHDIIINSGNELLTFKLTITRENGTKVNMVFKDPKKMFSVSISEACKVFNISEGKHEFDHNEVDEHYMNNTLDKFIKENRMKITDYVRQDGLLLEKLTICINKLYEHENINMHTVLTRSVASSVTWQKTIEQHRILKDVTLSPYMEICGVKYNDIMDHAIGGRTQCVRKGVFHNVCGIDVNSMYPYVCANNMYPCGRIVELKHGEIPPEDKLGLYLVKIKRQCYPHVIPYRKSKNYAYDWDSVKEFEKWMTNIDMTQLDDYEILKGFYWTDKTDKFYKDFMIDNYQLRCGIDKSDPRNLHIKLKMNGVTGSVFQHSFREMIMIFTKEEFESNRKRFSELVNIIGCEPINDMQYIVTMRPVRFEDGDSRIKVQREFCKGAITQKPWVLTMFTYSYARKYLRDEWIKLESKGCQVVYCDTDSLFFTNPNNIINRREYIHETKELGKWSIECWNDEGAFYRPKIYALKDVGKLRIKGIAYNSFIMDTKEKNIDTTYEQKLKIFLNLANNNAKKPSYVDVVKLINGTPLRSINFYMERSKVKGVEKKYEIKIIK
jgi:hypothetical protein